MMNEKNQNNISESDILKLEMDLGKLTKNHLAALMEKLGTPLPFKFWEQKQRKKNEIIRLVTMRVKRSEIPLNEIKGLIINELQRIEQQPMKTTKPKISFKDEISSLKLELSNIKKDVNVNNEKIDELDSNIQNLKELISDLSKTIHKNYIIDNMENLLKIIRAERTHIDKLSPDSFDSIKKNIKEKGYKDENILREGLAIMVLDYLIDTSKKLQFEEDIELFFKVLSETLQKETKLLDSAPIPPIREIITSKLNITHEDFDRMLVKCFSNGWVFLEGGSPIGESDVEYLTMDDKKYYYVKLKRKV